MMKDELRRYRGRRVMHAEALTGRMDGATEEYLFVQLVARTNAGTPNCPVDVGSTPESGFRSRARLTIGTGTPVSM